MNPSHTYLHRDIYADFFPDFDRTQTIDHINNDKEDNDITNLQLLSRNQNKLKQLMNHLYD